MRDYLEMCQRSNNDWVPLSEEVFVEVDIKSGEEIRDIQVVLILSSARNAVFRYALSRRMKTNLPINLRHRHKVGLYSKHIKRRISSYKCLRESDKTFLRSII